MNAMKQCIPDKFCFGHKAGDSDLHEELPETVPVPWRPSSGSACMLLPN